MNQVSIVGRMAKDAVVSANNNTTVARFTVAVDRRGKEKEADFISCVAFGKTAEFIEKYFSKGNRIGILGRIVTGSYTDKEGNKHYTTDVVADQAEFVESKKAEQPKETPDGFMSIPEGIDDELPFA